jgi:LacI family transcriptional regulator
VKSRCTLRDIAQETGYAVSTISNVLSDRESCYASQATRKRIREAVERLGYHPDYFARALRRRESRLVGIIGRMLTSEVQADQLAMVQRCLRREGYIAALFHSAGSLEETVSELSRINADGAVLFNDRDSFAWDNTTRVAIPMAAVSGCPIPGVPTAVIDRAEGVKRAVGYLAGLGHRKVLFAARKPKYNAGKLAGYRAGMRAAGLESEETVLTIPERWGETPSFVEENAGLISEVTAIVTSGDAVAAELLSGLRRIGISVPQDCSLIGFNDGRMAVSVSPKLTTCRQPREDLADAVTRTLLAAIRGKKPRGRRFIPELVLRESTAPPRSAH